LDFSDNIFSEAFRVRFQACFALGYVLGKKEAHPKVSECTHPSCSHLNRPWTSLLPEQFADLAASR
jgi:hypothetical protein